MLNYLLFRIILDFREKKFSQRIRRIFFWSLLIFLIASMLLLIIENIFKSGKSALTFKILMVFSIFLVELFILLTHLILRMKKNSKENKWLFKSFGLLLLIRYFFVIVILVIGPPLKSWPDVYKGIFGSFIYLLVKIAGHKMLWQ